MSPKARNGLVSAVCKPLRWLAFSALTVGSDPRDLDSTAREAVLMYVLGRRWHPPTGARRRHLLNLFRLRGHDILVEAGTYRGETVDYFMGHAGSIISVEIDPQLYEAAKRRFASCVSVDIRAGDALQVIPEVVAPLDSPPLVWLDGHFSGAGTGMGEKAEPAAGILCRLGPLSPGTTVVVDDLRLFGRPGYTELDELITSARRAFPGSRIRTGLDCLVIESPQPFPVE